MEREKETYGNSRGESKAEEQARMMNTALCRAAGFESEAPLPVSPEVLGAEATMPTNDAVINWGSGTTTIGPGGAPYDATLARVCGLPSARTLPTMEPDHFGAPLTSSPDCSEGNWNTERILKG